MMYIIIGSIFLLFFIVIIIGNYQESRYPRVVKNKYGKYAVQISGMTHHEKFWGLAGYWDHWYVGEDGLRVCNGYERQFDSFEEAKVTCEDVRITIDNTSTTSKEYRRRHTYH